MTFEDLAKLQEEALKNQGPVSLEDALAQAESIRARRATKTINKKRTKEYTEAEIEAFCRDFYSKYGEMMKKLANE